MYQKSMFLFIEINTFVTILLLLSVNGQMNNNKKNGAIGQSNIAYSQDNKGSYQFAYEVTDKGGATNFRQETGGPKAVKGSYGLTDVDGRTRLVNYQADKYGFVATVDTNEPGTGREDSANAAYNGADKGKGWAYAVAVQDLKAKNKFEGNSYQSYGYSNNYDEVNNNLINNNLIGNSDNGGTINGTPNLNEDNQYNKKNYDPREEYKNPRPNEKTTANEKQPEVAKKEEEIKNVNYESGGQFESTPLSNTDTEQPKTNSEENTDNIEENNSTTDEEPYDKRQMHLISDTKTSRNDYLSTIEKLADKDAKKNKKILDKKSAITKTDKMISKLISLSSFDDGTWTPKKYIK